MINSISDALEIRLKNSFLNFVKHAIEHATTENAIENDYIQSLINMQAALEMLCKYHVLRTRGWEDLLSESHRYEPEDEILRKIESGEIKTNKQWRMRDFTINDFAFNQDDIDLLTEFQELRNQAMHLGVLNPSSDLLNNSIVFFVRIIKGMNWKDFLSIDHTYLADSVKALLGDKIYNALISKRIYVDESIDAAYDINSLDVKLCLSCSNESWVLNDEGDRICTVCGYECNDDAVGFTHCPDCAKDETVAYDKMNLEPNNPALGKCVICQNKFMISYCKLCGNAHVDVSPCP